jgi:hypothetical protein
MSNIQLFLRWCFASAEYAKADPISGRSVNAVEVPKNRMNMQLAHGCSSLGEALRNFARTEVSHCRKIFELCCPRAGLALFPVVDRLPGHANQLPVARRG